MRYIERLTYAVIVLLLCIVAFRAARGQRQVPVNGGPGCQKPIAFYVSADSAFYELRCSRNATVVVLAPTDGTMTTRRQP